MNVHKVLQSHSDHKFNQENWNKKFMWDNAELESKHSDHAKYNI